jgi:transposase
LKSVFGRERAGGKHNTMSTSLSVLDPLAAFVDVGSEGMHVSVAGGPPEVFGAMTGDLERLRDRLQAQGVHSVAMEATGVYWLPLYGVLEGAGMKVLMVDGRQTRNVPGRKTDMSDCQWGATLHAHGLLRGGFVPPVYIRRLQDYMRLRQDHLSMAASHVQHMQKALERMNVKLHDVISNVVGVSGLAVIEGILAGERDPETLLKLCDVQIQKRKAQRVKESLRGTWAEEHLFALRQALESWRHYQQQVKACDQKLKEALDQVEASVTPPPPVPTVVAAEARAQVPAQSPAAVEPAKKSAGVNAPGIEGLGGLLLRLTGGKDLTQLPACTTYSMLQLISEIGLDLRVWPTEKQFTAWLGVAPGSYQSGKCHRGLGRKRNRAGRLLCVIVRSLARSRDCALGGFYRRMAGRRGGLVAIIATARKLAVLIWRAMVHGMAYVEEGLKAYEAKVLETKRCTLERLARQMGMQLLPAVPETASVPTP